MLSRARSVVVLSLITAFSAHPQNLLVNGSCDAGGDEPDGWDKTADVDVKRDTQVFKSAPASLCVISTGKDGNANCKVTDLAGKTVKITGVARRESGLGNAQVFTLTFDKQWKSLGWDTVLNVPGDDTWREFDKTVTFPENAGTVLFGLFAKCTGRAWLDDATIAVATDGGQPEPFETYAVEDLSRHQGSNPQLLHVGAVAPNVLSIHLREFFAEGRQFQPYTAEPGDAITTNKKGERVLKRDGKEVGVVVGPAGNEHVWTKARRTGKPLQLRHALDPSKWAILDADGNAIEVERIFRKTRPVDHSGQGYCREHFLFPKLTRAMVADARYAVRFGDINIEPSQTSFAFDTKRLRSEAVHVSQVGFRADDPAKLGFLSMWLGTGGPAPGYHEGMAFHLIDTGTGSVAHTGETVLRAKRTDVAHGLHHKNRNFELADTYVCDFSAFGTPGEYVLSVDGVGCSFPFRIGQHTWEHAWSTSMRGFTHQRSGLAWEKPWAAWERPRDLHPADGAHNTVYELSISELDFSTMLGDGNLKKLLDHKTETTLPDAWGGYHDAADYDRRQSHMVCSRMMMELFDLFPDYFRTHGLMVPETGNALPDILDEALWCPSLYRRMQREDGAVRGGIETNGHPKHGEPSHLDTLTKMAFAPDIRASWTFAATAAQAAHLLAREGHTDAASPWRTAAEKAMAWAESEYAADAAKYESLKNWWLVEDMRNLASVHLFRLTGDSRWHTLFLDTCGYKAQDAPTTFLWTSHDQAEAAIVYCRLENADPVIKEKARQAIVGHADFQLDYASKQAYMFTAMDLGSPLIISSHAAPRGLDLCRAHYVTGDSRYLEWAIKSSQFSVGNNPMNLVMTTGLGSRPAVHPLYLDMQYMAQPGPPPGITLYGIKDPKFGGWSWAFTWILKFQNNCFPDFQQWPLSEFYFDVYTWPMENEFTVQQSMAPAVYVWGYLAARPPGGAGFP